MNKLISINNPLPYCWKHAYLAYDEPDDHRSPLLSNAEVIPMKTELDFAYVAIRDDNIIIAFKGTGKDIHAWMSDFDPYPLRTDEYLSRVLRIGEWGAGIIHDGFYSGWKELKPYIDEIIKNYDLKKFKVFTCGHSRGGAFAELCSRHLAKNYGISNSCFTFGCPRIGTKDYRDQFRLLPINGTRVVHGWDIVPTVPPEAMGFKFGCANLEWIRKSWWKKFIPHIRISDHLSANYDAMIMKRFVK